MVLEPGQLDFSAAHVRLARNDLEPIESGGLNFVGQCAFTQKWPIRTCAFDLVQTNATRGIGLRVQVE